MCHHNSMNKENLANCGCNNNVSQYLQAGSETMCGTLVVRQGEHSNRLRRLVVKVYGKAIDPFVVFYQEKKFCNSCGFMKLRNCRVEVVDEYNFTIAPKDGDGNSLTFTVDSKTDLDSWITALRVAPLSPLRSATSILPSLQELQEEADDESDAEEEQKTTLVNDSRTAKLKRKSVDFRRSNSLTNIGLGISRHAIYRLERLAGDS